MKVLGIDPGATTGWALYDSEARRVLSRGTFPWHEFDEAHKSAVERACRLVIERPKGFHGSPGAVVDCGYVCGRIVGKYEAWRIVVNEMFRHEVRATLQEATHGVVRVRDDATVWEALLMLHGGAAAGEKPRRRKGVEVSPGGAIGSVVEHERAALAVAVAWALKSEPKRMGV